MLLHEYTPLGSSLPLRSKVVITNFVPPEEVSSVERRAQWNEEASAWLIPRLELAGNSLRMRRPVSVAGLPRPETEYARHRKGYDSNPRCVCVCGVVYTPPPMPHLQTGAGYTAPSNCRRRSVVSSTPCPRRSPSECCTV